MLNSYFIYRFSISATRLSAVSSQYRPFPYQNRTTLLRGELVESRRMKVRASCEVLLIRKSKETGPFYR